MLGVAAPWIQSVLYNLLRFSIFVLIIMANRVPPCIFWCQSRFQNSPPLSKNLGEQFVQPASHWFTQLLVITVFGTLWLLHIQIIKLSSILKNGKSSPTCFLDWLQLFYKYKRLSGWVLLASINSSNTLNSIDYCHLPFPKVKRGIIARSDITPWTLLWHGYLIGYVKPGCKLPAEKPYIVLKMIRVLFLSYMLTQLLTHCSTYCHIALSGLYWINLLQNTIPISKGDWVGQPINTSISNN